MKVHSRPADRDAGFSLVELMVALLLGIILTSGIISVYITSKKTYSVNNALGTVQENGRFSFNFMEPQLRMAGFTGCAHNIGKLTNHLNGGSDASLDLSKAVQGYEANGTGIGATYTITSANLGAANDLTKWTPNLPADVGAAINGSGFGAAIAGNDIIVLHEAASNGISLVSPYQDSAGVFVSPADAGLLAVGEIAVMTDCTKSDLFQITQANTSSGRIDHSSASLTPGNTGSNWIDTFGAGAQLLAYNSYVYYVGVGIDGGPSLFRVSLGSNTLNGAYGAPQELVPGVESMQILYGVDTDADKIPNNFQTADTVDSGGNWANVVSVRIGLLIRSDDSSTDQTPSTAPSYVLLDPTAADGVTITTLKDRRLRRSFQETISIRNLLP